MTPVPPGSTWFHLVPPGSSRRDSGGRGPDIQDAGDTAEEEWSLPASPTDRDASQATTTVLHSLALRRVRAAQGEAAVAAAAAARAEFEREREALSSELREALETAQEALAARAGRLPLQRRLSSLRTHGRGDLWPGGRAA